MTTSRGIIAIISAKKGISDWKFSIGVRLLPVGIIKRVARLLPLVNIQNNYGLVCDLSKNIDDMGFSYNALHMYEHLMTHCWDDIDKKNLSILKTNTYP